jgi:cation transport regulator ChaC
MKDKASVTIFGYGSLMSDYSLRVTAPDAKNIRPVWVKGFRREFSKQSERGWHTHNLDLAGIPYCSVDVIVDRSKRVNGVVFEAGKNDLAALEEREDGYELVSTIAYDFETGKSVGKCFTFSANRRNGIYESDNPAQKRYIDLCLEAAKEYGEEFYRQFLATTYIGEKTLDEII